MQILSHPLPLILCLFAMALHFLPPLLGGVWRGRMRYVNICLHIALYTVFLFASIPLGEVALFYLVSLLVYLCSVLLLEKSTHSSDEKEVEK